MKKIIYSNSLSIVFVLLFFITLVGQLKFGREEYNKPVDAPHNETGG